MLDLRIPCSACQAVLSIRDPALLGRNVRCPSCNAVTRVPPITPPQPPPGPEASFSFEPSERITAPRMSRRPRPKSGGKRWLGLGAALVGCVCLAGVGAFGLGLWPFSQEGDQKLSRPPAKRPDPDQVVKNLPNQTPTREKPKPSPEVKIPPRANPPPPTMKNGVIQLVADPTLPLPARDAAEDARRAEERARQWKAGQAIEKALTIELDRSASTSFFLMTFATWRSRSSKKLQAMALSPDGLTLATDGEDRVVTLWDLRTGKLKNTLPGHSADIKALAFSRDGRTLASADASNTVRIWDVRSGAAGQAIASANRITQLAFDANGQILAFGTSVVSTVMQRLNKATGKLEAHLTIPRYIQALAVHPFWPVLATGDSELGVRLWNWMTGQAYKVEIPLKNPCALTFSPDGWALAVAAGGQEKPTVVLYDLAAGKRRELAPCKEMPKRFHFHPDGKLLIGAGDDVCLWDLATGRLLRQHPGLTVISDATFCSVGGEFLIVLQWNELKLFRLEDLLDERLPVVLEALKSDHIVTRLGLGFEVRNVHALDGELLKALFRVPRLRSLEVETATGLGDDGLARLAALPNLERLVLNRAGKVTDAGVVSLKKLSRLRVLGLGGADQVTDKGVGELAGLSGLVDLRLEWMKVSGEGLKPFAKLASLQNLDLTGTPIGDDDLAVLAGFPALEKLGLRATKITDAGIRHLAAIKQLKSLDLGSNKGIRKPLDLAKLTSLTGLKLGASSIEDEGMEALRGLVRVTELEVGGTPITDAGLAPLAGWTELRKLGLGFNHNLTGTGLRHLKRSTKLVHLDLQYTQVTDAGLAGISEWAHLEHLTLPAHISDAGLAHLAGLTNLQSLGLRAQPNIKGPGLRHLAKLTRLVQLNLSQTGLTDAGLEGASQLTHVKKITLPDAITDAGIKHLSGLASLVEISAHGPGITDGILEHLRGLKNLKLLEVRGSKITRAGAARITKALPGVFVTGI